MKKKILALLILFVSLSFISFGQTTQSEKNKLSLSFKNTEYDFKSVPEEMGYVSTSFYFTNTGKEPIVINRVQTSCGCTIPEYSRSPILPGKDGSIVIKYSAKGRPGIFKKDIKVFTNVPDTIYQLQIKGNVLPIK